MEVYDTLMEYFSFSELSGVSTFPDLINYLIQIGVSVYITAFMIRSLFLMIAIPDSSIWS